MIKTAGNRLWRRVLVRIAVLALVLAAAPYAWGPVYQFPVPSAFTGNQLWNPYVGLGGSWQRANFHAHGRAWAGLTNGQQPDVDVERRYLDLGYDVASVSDYMRIAARDGIGTVPVYEHGYNAGKAHQIAIGARDVEWLDFVFWQGLSHQQYIIDRVKRKSELVALAHPATRDAYTGDVLRNLTRYDLIEVVNGPFVTEDVWDTALSSGHPVWAIANDDTHDLADMRRTAAGWNMIEAPSPSEADIVGALKAGRTYAVLRTGAIEASHLTVVDRVDVENAKMSISISGAPSTFRFVGQNGAVRKTVKDTLEADYTFTDADTYVRTVITSPQTILYLNPVLRHDGRGLPSPAATVDVASTWLLRGSSGLGCLLLGLAVIRRRRFVPHPATRPVLVGAKRNTA